MEPKRTAGKRVFVDACASWQERGRLSVVIMASDTPLLGVPTLSPVRLDQVVLAMDADQEIPLADGRIRALNGSGKFEEALQVAQELVARFPEDARAHFVLGGTFDFQDRETDAVPPYQRAWELGLSGDDVPRFYVQYGSTLRNVGQYDEAVRVLLEGQERFPESVAIAAFLALALFSAGRTADALATSLSLLVEYPQPLDLQGYERALRYYIADLQASDPTS